MVMMLPDLSESIVVFGLQKLETYKLDMMGSHADDLWLAVWQLSPVVFVVVYEIG